MNTFLTQLRHPQSSQFSAFKGYMIPILISLHLGGCIVSNEEAYTLTVEEEPQPQPLPPLSIENISPVEITGTGVAALSHQQSPTSLPDVTSEICSPQAKIWRSEWRFNIPLRAWVEAQEGSSCSGIASGTRSSSLISINGEATFGDAGEERCDEDGCWRAIPRFAQSWREAPDPQQLFVQGGSLWSGVIEARRNVATGHLEALVTATHRYTTEVRQMTRRWDEEGRLLFEKIDHNQRFQSEVRIVWRGSQLARVEVIDPFGEGGHSVREMEYDQEHRLSRIRITDFTQGKLGLVEWTYDDAGRPVQLTRSLLHPTDAPTLLERVTWSFDERGALSARDFERTLSDRFSRHALFRGTDNFNEHSTWHHSGWGLGGLRFDEDSGCTQLPVNVEAGYPLDGGHYDLGWPLEFRPMSIGINHGFQGVYTRGDLGWMGHFGPQAESSSASSYIQLGLDNLAGEVNTEEGKLVVTTQYTDNELSEEVAEWVSSAEEDEASSHITLSHRDWTRAGGLLQKDRMNVLGERDRELQFLHNDQGQVTRRSLFKAGELIARHQWSRVEAAHAHPACSIAQYEIGFDVQAMVEEGQEVLWGRDERSGIDQVGDEVPNHFTQYASYTVDQSEGCREVTLHGGSEPTLDLRFDENHRLIHQGAGLSMTHLYSGSLNIEYGARDKITALTLMLDVDRESDHDEQFRFDEEGRLIHHSMTRDGVLSEEDLSFICE